MANSDCSWIPLASLGAIAVTGADAESFLAAQLSQTPPVAGARRAPLAAWHDAKGRVQALFRVVRREEGGFDLLTHTSVAATVAADLRRYVLRARVEILARRPPAAAALVGDGTAWLGARGIDLPDTPAAAVHANGATWVRLGPALVHVVAAAPRLATLGDSLPLGAENDAELAEIRLGLPVLSEPLRGQFLPQMLNLDLLDGIAFDKGCYPGQEIIARTQHRGSVKRRMRRVVGTASSAVPAPGSALLDAAGTPVGVVVRAARAAGTAELLAIVPLTAAEDLLYCAAAPTEPLGAAALPYAPVGASDR